MSALRKVYMGRLVGRCLVLLAATILLFLAPEQYDILHSDVFFRRFSLGHILWAVWMADMLSQLMPIRKGIVALGSQKSFKRYFRAVETAVSQVRASVKAATKRAYAVFLIWTALILALGLLYAKKILGDRALLWISILFYVCDLICVLFWCPFRHFIMKNRCCTTCRIFNWDHLMMFTPLIYVKGFFSYSLVAMAITVFVVWELSVLRHPERFVENSNRALKCMECTDKLCINARKIHK